MPPNPKIVNAFRAMKNLGISEDKVKPVLKHLLRLYDKNWELIEAENYRVLVDTIFENDESEAAAKNNAASNEREHEEEDEVQEQDELERPFKRLRLRQPHHQSSQPHHQSSQDHHSSSLSTGFSLILPNDEPVELPEVPAPELLQSMEGTIELCNGEMTTGTQHGNSQLRDKNKMKQLLSPNNLMIQDGESLDSERAFLEACTEEPRTGEGLASPRIKIAGSQVVIDFKEEPPTDVSVQCVVPLAVEPPETRNGGCSSQKNSPTREQDSFAHVISESVPGKHASDGFPATSDIRTGGELARVLSESSSQLEIATSPLGEVKLSLSYNSPGRSDFHMPDIDTVVKLVEARCLQSYKILDPNFSVMKLLKDICECFLQQGSEKSEEQTQTSSKTDPSETFSSTFVVSDLPSNAMNGFCNTQLEADMDLPISLESPLPVTSLDSTSKLIENGAHSNGSHSETEQNSVVDTNSKSLVVVQEHQLTPDPICSLHDVIDICKGHERVVISLVNDVNNESPPSFHYIPQNVVFQNAYVNFSLARIGDDNCCSHCFGDCLSLSTTCACAHETGGEFAYTAEGLVKEEFLEECVSMNRDPEKHCQFFCKECPLERSKNEAIIEPCKGHLVRKFIKECWWKCCCKKQCGNRVVQRGITRKLQVFMTKGKGWALRTLEDLPKGTFVCEYVGEVLTNAELFDRVSKCPEGEKHSYPVLLDADWGSEGVLNDEEALCLDATYYGNVARFINHRCFDSTLVEIPVEIETPDHHYYHLAFFTSRKVKAMEELTWDYGIDFTDRDHPVKAFRCQCGSRFCRNTRRPRRFRFGRR